MDINNDFFRNNAEQIGKNVLNEIKTHHLTNKEIADYLECNENIISRKNRNVNGAYYNKKNLEKLAVLFNCSFEKLCLEEFNNDILIKDKIRLENKYKKSILYLHSIGVHLEPAYFWTGNNEQFLQAKKIIAPYFNGTSKLFYKANKKNIDNGSFPFQMVLLLTGNPIENHFKTQLDDIKIQTPDIPFKPRECLNIVNFDIDTLNNTKFTGDFEELTNLYNEYCKLGKIEIRFMVHCSGDKEQFNKSISIKDVNNILEFMENITKTSVKGLLNNFMSDFVEYENLDLYGYNPN